MALVIYFCLIEFFSEAIEKKIEEQEPGFSINKHAVDASFVRMGIKHETPTAKPPPRKSS